MPPSPRRGPAPKPPAKRLVVLKKPPQVSWREKAANVELNEWYSSEDAKRAFGNICRAVSVQRAEVHLMGSEQRPLVTLVPAEDVPPTQFEIAISIDEAKADWSGVLLAVMLFGTAFRVSGPHHTHAVLRRHHLNRHSALRYRRPQLEDIPQNFAILLDDMREMSDTFSKTTSLIDRRFKEVWRDKNM